MHTEAELEAKIVSTERWLRVSLLVEILALVAFVLRVLWRPMLREFFGEDWIYWRVSLNWIAYVVLALATLSAAGLKWRLWRLEDAASRARTVSKLSGRSNSRVTVLGETQPRSTK